MRRIKGMSEPVWNGNGYSYTFTLEGLQQFLENYYEIYGELPYFMDDLIKKNGE